MAAVAARAAEMIEASGIKARAFVAAHTAPLLTIKTKWIGSNG
jgi:hypothetical protein